MAVRLPTLSVPGLHRSSADPRRGVIVARLADALRALGHVVEFLPLGHGGGALRYVRARPRVAARVRTYAPDVVHVHFGYSAPAVPALPVPVITSSYRTTLTRPSPPPVGPTRPTNTVYL